MRVNPMSFLPVSASASCHTGMLCLLLLVVLAGGVRSEDELDAAEHLQRIRMQVAHRQVMLLLTGKQSHEDLRTHCDILLKQKVDDLDRICALTRAQTEKLTIAGRVEIDRLFADLNIALDEFDRRNKEANADPLRGGAIQPVVMQYRPGIKLRMAEMFEKDSLLEKSIRKSLTPEQQQRVNQIHEERLTARYRAHVEGVVVHWDQNLALRKEQRRQLVELLLKETKPPPEGSKLKANAVWIQAAHLPEERFLAILDREQWQLLEQELEHVRQNEAMMKQDPLPGGGFF